MTSGPTAPAALRVVERRVPKFDLVGRAYERPEMNRLQRSFYLRDFRPGFLTGHPVDVNDQAGFVSAMFHELADTIETDPGALAQIRRLVETYRDGGGLLFPRRIVADTYFLEGDFVVGYEAFSRIPRMNLYLALAEYLGHPPLTAMDIFWWTGRKQNPRAYASLQEIFDRLEVTLDAFHAEHGLSVIEEFWQRLNVDASVEDVARSVEDDVIEHYSGDDVRAILSRARDPEYPRAVYRAFGGYAEVQRPIDWPSPWILNDVREHLLTARCRQLFRDAENAQRHAEGLPGVGKGWVSEAALLRELERAFPEERIVHQWRPSWLGSQSLDIAFPYRLVGVEYQGAQHSGPVEFFGGEEAFKRQQARDRNKRQLCESNGFELIEVHPGYVIDEVVDLVRAALDR
ncbi:hypothetical protein [Agromyces sp. GXS1127]|uniref:hypothetical protein n=1 Tax=Agromyces sp. GXS1127 TaxID=3424181 RepID=UPI003D31BC8D